MAPFDISKINNAIARLSPKQRQYAALAAIMACGVGALWAVFAFTGNNTKIVNTQQSPASAGAAAPTNIGVMAPGQQVNPVDQWAVGRHRRPQARPVRAGTRRAIPRQPGPQGIRKQDDAALRRTGAAIDRSRTGAARHARAACCGICASPCVCVCACANPVSAIQRMAGQLASATVRQSTCRRSAACWHASRPRRHDHAGARACIDGKAGQAGASPCRVH